MQRWMGLVISPLSLGVSLLIVLTMKLLGPPAAAWGQGQFATIRGEVVERASGRPLPSVTVVVTGPALPGVQSDVSDADGHYAITGLPPGDDYWVGFYFGSDDVAHGVRSGIHLSIGKTVWVDGRLDLDAGSDARQVIKEPAPNIDTASAAIGVEIPQEMLQNSPVRGRTAESIFSLAPATADVAPRLFGGVPYGAPGGEVGVSISGATGNENTYIIDGINSGDPNRGLIGTELSQYFIKEVSVLSAGYPAEFGRATGGVVTIATRSGGNELHGSIFGSVQPYQLDAPVVARLGEALALREKTQIVFDFGFDLGGYLLKDRIWFYLGFAPTFTRLSAERQIRQQVYDETTGQARRASDVACPSYLADSLLCLGPRRAALLTQELDGAGRELTREKRLYNVLAKVDFNLTPNHRVTLSYLGAPTTYDDYRLIPGQTLDVDQQKYTRVDQLHDLGIHYLGKLFARRLQLDINYGYHYQRIQESPEHPETPFTIYYADVSDPYSLADFEDVPACRRQTQTYAGMQRTFNPCPLTQYQRGFGYTQRDYLSQRHMLTTAMTAHVHATHRWNPLRGIHALKLGFELDLSTADNYRSVTGTDLDPNDPASGHRSYFVIADGGAVRYNETAQRDVQGCRTPLAGDGAVCLRDGFRGLTQTNSFVTYLRDSWQVGWAPGLVVNLGLRWEAQELYGMAQPTDPERPRIGDKAIGIYDNWAPRIGLVYDFTQRTRRPGRGKLFVNYGRYYESLPLAINDHQFTGEGFYASGFTATCPDRNPQGHRVPDVTAPGCRYPPGALVGGALAQVAPRLKGQYTDELAAGLSYDLGLDIVAGVSYIHRTLGNVIEDVLTDGGRVYFITNPGQPADPRALEELESAIRQASPQSSAYSVSEICRAAPATVGRELATACGRYASYVGAGTVFPKPRRDYDALILTVSKRLSNRFSLIGSYTFSRAIGNYPGTYNGTKGQLEPNMSTQYDLTDLLANRMGPLPTDRPHNFKATGYFEQPVRDGIKVTVGLTFTAISGRPIDVLGSHLYYGANEVFILPRGSGGRTPTVTQLDLHVGYDQRLSPRVRLVLFCDIVNVADQRQVTNVEDSYTFDPVAAIASGKPSDLRHLRTIFGTLPSINSNYGQPTAFQAPMYFRMGGRLSF